MNKRKQKRISDFFHKTTNITIFSKNTTSKLQYLSYFLGNYISTLLTFKYYTLTHAEILSLPQLSKTITCAVKISTFFKQGNIYLSTLYHSVQSWQKMYFYNQSNTHHYQQIYTNTLGIRALSVSTIAKNKTF